MKSRAKLSSEERRHQILKSAVPLFAEKGFSGVTTKQIAKSAGVSEALLYQHFPSKDILFERVQDFCCHIPQKLDSFVTQPPSTEAMIIMLFILAESALVKPEVFDPGGQFARLMLRSMIEDGQFARIFVQRQVEAKTGYFIACHKAARAAGDIDKDIESRSAFWFAHHAVVTIAHMTLPVEPIVQYGKPKPELVDEVMKFVMRGLGLSEAAIAAKYNLSELRKLDVWGSQQ